MHIYMHIHVHIHVQLLVAVQPDTLLLQHLSRSAARAIVCCVCVLLVCVCNGRHKLTNNFFTFHLVCAHCLPFFVAFSCCSFCCCCSSSPPLLPLSRLYVRRACVYFLFLLSRIFMQSAALHFLTLQLLFAFRFVLFSVCVCPVFVCALCVYAMRRFVVSFNCTDTSLILSCSFQLLLFSSCSSSSYCSCCSCCSCCCCYRISCRRFALVCTRQQPSPSQSQQRRNFEFGRCVGPPTAAAATLTLTPQQLKLRSSLACLIA